MNTMTLAAGLIRPALSTVLAGTAIALLALALLSALWSGSLRRLLLALRRPGNPDANATSMEPLGVRIADLSTRITQVEESLTAEVRALTEILAEREMRTMEMNSDATTRRELEQIYRESFKAMDPLLHAMNKLRPSVLSLAQSGSDNSIAPVLNEYEALARMCEELDRIRQDLAQHLDTDTSEIERCALGFRAGQVPPHEYLACVHAKAAAAQAMSISPRQARERLTLLAASLEEGFLAWVDALSELRDAAAAGQKAVLQLACAQLISQASDVVECWDVRLVDVPVGSTRYDSRLHDLYASIPRADVSPETVIAVRRLGHRKGGVLVRKPQVLVAAASS